jgi:uncharacterized protein YfaQ (DUF2300 family)
MPVKLRHIIKHTLAGSCAALFIFSRNTAFAGSVQQACLTAGPSKANYRVCRCIQSAADATLSVKDQSLAAAIIRNPDNVTELKSSKRRNHALFMEGYSQFGELARAFCS